MKVCEQKYKTLKLLFTQYCGKVLKKVFLIKVEGCLHQKRKTKIHKKLHQIFIRKKKLSLITQAINNS